MKFDLDEFDAVNLQRCESPQGFNHKIESWSLSDWMTATMGELGEAANIVKKLNRCRDGINGNTETEAMLREKLARELADVFIYLSLTAQAAGIKLSDVVPAVFDAKSEQIGYPVRLSKPQRTEVFSRPECVFCYCPSPELCQIGCINTHGGKS